MPLSKQEIREAIRSRKLLLSGGEIARRSELLCRKVLQTEAYREAGSVYGYLPFNQEVRLLPLLEQALLDGKQVALPKCRAKEMRFIRMEDLSRIQYTCRGVPEPIADGPVASDPRALVIVPGLAFNSRGYRIGYGGGYYDRFLQAEPTHPTIGLCYDFQLLEQLTVDPHDVPVDTLLWI